MKHRRLKDEEVIAMFKYLLKYKPVYVANVLMEVDKSLISYYQKKYRAYSKEDFERVIRVLEKSLPSEDQEVPDKMIIICWKSGKRWSENNLREAVEHIQRHPNYHKESKNLIEMTV